MNEGFCVFDGSGHRGRRSGPHSSRNLHFQRRKRPARAARRRRSGKQTARVSGPREQIFVKGRPVNVALSWGEAGLILSVDGRELSRAPFSGKLSPMPGSFSVSAGPPFFASAIRVSARQLQGAELDSTPDTPFPPGESTTLLADLRSGKTELLTAAGQSGATLLPVWSFDDSLSLPGEKAVLRLSGANFSDTEQDFLLRLTGRETDGAALPEVRETIRIPARTRQKEFQIELPVRTPGHYSFTLECGGERYVFSHAELNRPDAELPDGRFADYIGHHLFDLPHVLAKTGIRNSRSDAFHWFIVEPEKGQFDWRWSDAIVERNREAGIRMLGILGSPPVWAADSAIVPTHKNADMSARASPPTRTTGSATSVPSRNVTAARLPPGRSGTKSTGTRPPRPQAFPVPPPTIWSS